MIDATYFGEITQLHTRAVWYSDEEDDDEDENVNLELRPKTPVPKAIEPLSHETLRSNIQVNFTRIEPELKLNFSTCIVSVSSSAKFQNYKLSHQLELPYFGYFDSYGKAFAFPILCPKNNYQPTGEYVLWLLFDSSHQYISGQEIGYFVEQLRERLRSEFNLFCPNSANCEIIILSQQYSRSENIEYLTNFNNNNNNQNTGNNLTPLLRMPLPFLGRQILPPAIIRNNFESSLFEQLTLSLKPAQLVCLPCPRDFLFDKTLNWPTIPEEIIKHKFHDNDLDDKYIFT